MAQPKTDKEKRADYLRQWEELKSERLNWEDRWQELADYVEPEREELNPIDTLGERRDDYIINSIATIALRTLAAGMTSGITSPARPWFRLTPQTPGLEENEEVKAYLFMLEELIRSTHARSNLYKSLPQVYADIGLPGTAVMSVEEDEKEVLRTEVWPIGSFWLANDARGRVSTVYRLWRATVAQVVERFGVEKCSRRLQEAHKDRKGMQDRVEVLHVVSANEDAVPGRLDYKGMAYKSCWMELVGDDDKPFLLESGYHEMPYLCPRWRRHSNTPYGVSPGMVAIGDVKALQLLEKRGLQLAEKLVNPPLAVPSSLMGRTVSLLPGDVTHVDAMAAGAAVRPIHEVPPQAVGVLEEKIRQHEERIRRAFFADLFLMLDSLDKSNMTAREVIERTNERMLQLGPTLETLNDELLDPLIERTVGMLLRGGHLPPAPPELVGVDTVKVEYIGILAQAQKALGTGNLRDLLGLVSGMAEIAPSMMDKLDTDQLVDEYAKMLGVPPTVVRSDEAVEAMRAARAAQAQEQQAAQQAMAATEGAKNLAQSPVGEGNALEAILRSVGTSGAAGSYPER